MDRVALGLALAALLAGTASAEMLGLASSYNGYTITRADASVQAPAQTSSAIQLGDRVAAGDARVKLETLSGQALLLAENSEATVGAEALELHRGEVAMSLTGNSKDVRTISCGGLNMIASAGTASEGATLVAVKAIGENEIQVTSQGREVEVLGADGKSVASVKSRQIVVLSRKDKNSAWTTAAAEPKGSLEAGTVASDDNDVRYAAGSFGSALTGSKDAKELGNGTFKLGKQSKEASNDKKSLFTSNGSESQQKRLPGSKF